MSLFASSMLATFSIRNTFGLTGVAYQLAKTKGPGKMANYDLLPVQGVSWYDEHKGVPEEVAPFNYQELLAPPSVEGVRAIVAKVTASSKKEDFAAKSDKESPY